ncbi:MAG: ATP-binding protein [Thermodesulfovibrionia bacterium]|nr:ATP-binding protein [Thermodesulfovibrionia bacterium]
MLNKVTREELCNCCDLSDLPFKTTDDVQPLEGTIGQERALSALEFGLDINSHGFNIYILGESGTGKMTTIRKILEEKAKDEPTPDDWCYVYSFKNPDVPNILNLPAGTGVAFKKKMDELINDLQQEIPKIFESKEYEKQKTNILHEFQEKQKELFAELEKEAEKKDFSLQKNVSGLALLPTKKTGEALTEDEYEKLEPEAKKKIGKIGKELQDKLDDVIRLVRAEENEVKKKIAALERQAVFSSVGHRIDEIKNGYKENDKILSYLEDVQEDILEHHEDFKMQDEQPQAFSFMKPPKTEPSFMKYQVNVLVNNLELKGAPIVIETNPTYLNLFGRVEHKLQYGVAVTDFTMIKPGALHKANGGYLVTDALDLLKNIFSYDALKRTIKDREIRIEDVWEQYRQVSTVTLKPQPVPFDVKVILVGNPRIYYLLYNLDEEYRELFKIKADYENRMERNKENILKYASFIKTKCLERDLHPFDQSAIAKVIEHGSRLAEHKNKLSAKFSEIADILREAAYWSKKRNNGNVTYEDVEKALNERIYRSDKVQRKILEAIKDGTILVDMEGSVVGQINGLAVLDLGDYSFGMPSRITAKTYAGKAGIVNIERETKMSGKIHEKAILILTAYLGGKYATKRPLSLTASLTFEQLYGGIEGDSATCAEVYALLSSISGVPINQSIAITGSMNQHGEVQPIGGVNEKIEGFFEFCKISGLTGKQGVIIPRRNLINLMVRNEVFQAVMDGKFSIYSIDNIEDGIEILMGMPAGEITPDEKYPKGTVNFLVAEKLLELSKASKDKPEKKGTKKSDEDTADKK